MSLDALIEAVEAGALNSNNMPITDLPPGDLLDAYDGSLDAALALQEALLPGWRYFYGWTTGVERIFASVWDPEADWECITVENQTPARAWIIAILRAYKQVQANG